MSPSAGRAGPLNEVLGRAIPEPTAAAGPPSHRWRRPTPITYRPRKRRGTAIPHWTRCRFPHAGAAEGVHSALSLLLHGSLIGGESREESRGCCATPRA